MKKEKWYKHTGLYALVFMFLVLSILKYNHLLKCSWIAIFMVLIIPFGVGALIIFFTVMEAMRTPPFFTNDNGHFEAFDVGIDKKSAIRPDMPGILKHDPMEGWFIVYEDGFEATISDIKYIEKWNN